MNRKGFNKHKDLILAWASGAAIQFYDDCGGMWSDINTPIWSFRAEYRIKPAEPRLWYVPVYNNGLLGYMRDARLYEEQRDSTQDVMSWIRVVEDTSFVPDKPST